MLGDMPVWYLFLGGSGAGLLLVASVMMLLVPLPERMMALGIARGPEEVRAAHRSLSRVFVPACAGSGALLAMGVICLASDLGITERALLLFRSPRPTFLTVGAWLLVTALLADAALLFVWVREPRFLPRSIRVIPALSACLGLGVAAYTGLLLRSLAAVPLWDTVALPLLFVASSLSCGVSLMLAIVRLSGVGWRFEAVAAQWERADIAVLLVEAVAGIGFVAIQVFRAQSGSTGTLQALALSLQTLLTGPDAWVFWGVFGGLGIAVPLALAGISLLEKPSPMMPFAQASATLIGAFAMRWSIVQAGMHPVLQSAGLS